MVPEKKVWNFRKKRYALAQEQVATEVSEFQERVIDIKRVAKVVKGGRRFSFTALIAIGDTRGRLGLGSGKAKEVSEAIRKATEAAKKKLVHVRLYKGTLPHTVLAKFGASKIMLKPAGPGTGLIAGGAARAVLEVAGVQNILTKILGSRSSHNVAKAVLLGLQQSKSFEDIKKLRNM
jgi:small subunit ribosomal protein S5